MNQHVIGPSNQHSHRNVRKDARIIAAGKQFSRNGETLYLRGVTYGTFASNENGEPYPCRQQVAQDLKSIASCGFNTVRTYTCPPRWLLDEAEANGLQVLAGMAWEQHVAFLDNPGLARDIRARVRKQVESCAGHPGILGFSIGNEIPPSIVRWHGPEKVRKYLWQLFDIAKSADPCALVTYVNFPTTEYLELPFLDFCAFNVYLEEEAKLISYLRRLQNIAGDLPLVMTEIGLDSRRNGEVGQAESIDWQVHCAFREGCAGAFVYAWTDEWHRGGEAITDWDFGLTTRSRNPKKAFAVVSSTMKDMPFGEPRAWPMVSVVVCSYNGSATIRDTLENLARLDYPNYEVIVIDDGSKDQTFDIAAQYNVRLISTANRGLGQARNEGLEAARGEIVVYIDDDAYPPTCWLRYIGHAFMETDHTCLGGPNLCPPEDGLIGQCVADSPGGPLCVLMTDDLAEHVPGCNMAFRRERLAAIGGFDPRFREAGDDVDMCWRLEEKGWTIGYVAGAMVWHHRRATLRRYWRQQVGYGKAESLLEQKWPRRFSDLGHLNWSGRIYGRGLLLPIFGPKPRIYHGQWGLAPYQGVYTRQPNSLVSLAQTPEWLLPIACSLGLGMFGFVYPPLAWATLPGLVLLGVYFLQALRGAQKAKCLLRMRNLSLSSRAKSFSLIFIMHLLQPAARLWGRLKHGLTPWRHRKRSNVLANNAIHAIWSDRWHAPDTWLEQLESKLTSLGALVGRGGTYDSWDLQMAGGVFQRTRLVMAIEDHEGGTQFLRFRRSFAPTNFAIFSSGALLLFFLASAWQQSNPGMAIASVGLVWLLWQMMSEHVAAENQVNACLANLVRDSGSTIVSDQPDRVESPGQSREASRRKD
jgi:glycosyltransferase involved in cell wall biosynthesis